MKMKTSQELYQEHLQKGTSPEVILKLMINRADRYQEYYQNASGRLHKLQEDNRNLLRTAGRLVTVSTDHIVHDQWGTYTWYKYRKYRYEGKGIWKKYSSEGSHSPHYRAKDYYGVFKVNILLEPEDMPKAFTGVCTGIVSGKKVIMAQGHMIAHGDEFVMYKKEKKND